MIPPITPDQAYSLEKSGYTIIRGNRTCAWVKDSRGMVAQMDWWDVRELATLLVEVKWKEE